MTRMTIPTEPIGSIPRPPELLVVAAATRGAGPSPDVHNEEAIRAAIARFEATGSPVVTDGEQRKYHNFLTDCVHGLPNAAGHVRSMPHLTAGPLRYSRPADGYLDVARWPARKPVIQAIISPSALSLIEPEEESRGDSRRQFIDDLLNEHDTEVRAGLREGAHKPAERLGTTDDCGPAPFRDDTSTNRDTPFAKARARGLGTALAAEQLGGG
jgi:5-methyltetrahydropteroyltriglutamate--homocysteine methyltransferase